MWVGDIAGDLRKNRTISEYDWPVTSAGRALVNLSAKLMTHYYNAWSSLAMAEHRVTISWCRIDEYGSYGGSSLGRVCATDGPLAADLFAIS